MARIFGALALALWVVPGSAHAETLNFCYDPFPPYTIGEEGTPTGGSKVKLLEEVVARIDGLSATVTIMPWKRCQAEAKSGNFDGILPLFPNDERLGYLAFSIGTFKEKSVLWLRTEQLSQDFSWNGDYDDLSHLRLGMLTGSYIDDTLETTFENAKGITRARDIQTLMELLIKERVDLVATDAAVGDYILVTNGWRDQVRRLQRPISSRTSHFGLSKTSGADRYVEKFDQVIRQLAKDGTLDRIIGDGS